MASDFKKFIKATVTTVALLEAGMDIAQALPRTPREWEMCLGVAKKGMNDCGSTDGRHTCSAKSTYDGDPTEWIWVPRGTCKKISGGEILDKVRVKISSKLCERVLVNATKNKK